MSLQEIARRWSLQVGEPYCSNEGGSHWVGPAARPDGTVVVLKWGRPHMESEQEADGLRFWSGDAAVRLLDTDLKSGALLLERCEPGTPLNALPEPEQDVVLAGLLRRLWRVPPSPHPFRPLSWMLNHWVAEALASRRDAGLIREGAHVFDELSRTAPQSVLLTTDLHAGNVLRSQREPWLVIDPKPFLGDPAYDATQHLLNCPKRMHTDPDGTMRRFADLLEVDAERVQLWMFARAAAGPVT